MSEYFARLAQRSGMNAPANRASPSEMNSPSSTVFEQDVVTDAPQPTRGAPPTQPEASLAFAVEPSPSLLALHHALTPPAVGEPSDIVIESVEFPAKQRPEGVSSEPRSVFPSPQKEAALDTPSNASVSFQVTDVASFVEPPVPVKPSAPVTSRVHGAAQVHTISLRAAKIKRPSAIAFDIEQKDRVERYRVATPRSQARPSRSFDRRSVAKIEADDAGASETASLADGPIEIRIGAITLELKSQEPTAAPAPPPQPVRGDGFSLNRHYLRSW